jgi:hypothetical protein
MTNDTLIARLAAANPVPTGVPVHEPAPLRLRRRHLVLALAAAAAVLIPAAAFGDLPGLSNQGSPVATSSTPFSQDSGLNEAMQELGFPSTLQLLGTRDGISFYAARRADGHFCFAVQTGGGRGVGCDLNDDSFPSATRPVLLWPAPRLFAGFAADGVATVALLDASGATLATAPVSDNLFVGADRPAGAVAVEALDAQGNAIATRQLP